MNNNKIISKIVVMIFLILLVSSGASATNYELKVSQDAKSTRTLGNQNAKVTILMYTDFQDPFSARWFENTFPEINEKYIKTGNVKLAIKYFPLTGISKESFNVAVAAECASKQNRFFDYIEVLYKNQKSWKMSIEDLKAYSTQIKLDQKKFDICFNRYSTVKKTIQTEYEEGKNKGITGTPTFFINEQKIVGAQPTENFIEIIKSELSKN